MKWQENALVIVGVLMVTGCTTTSTSNVPNSAEITPVAVTASDWEKAADGGWGDFPPQLTIDGSLDPKSSWRAEGDGAWLEYDLGEAVVLRGLQIAFLKGDERQYTFDIQISNSGAQGDWQTVLDRQLSTGASAQMETYSFKPAEAQYIRVIGHGNSDEDFGKWTNIVEIRFEPK